MNDFYREIIIAHYKNPKNFGRLKDANFSFESVNSVCGDKMLIDLKIDEEGMVKDLKFSGEGCSISIATASMLTEKVKGKKIKFLKSLTKDDMVKMLGIDLSPTRLKCALLPLEAAQKAVKKM